MTQITNYDPNIVWAHHIFELTFMQWDYSLTVEVDVCGNCKGASLFGAAIRTVFDELYDEDDNYAKIILKRTTIDGDENASESGFDTLEIDLEDEDELAAICIGIHVVGHVKESRK